jgi:hypothetical protein
VIASTAAQRVLSTSIRRASSGVCRSLASTTVAASSRATLRPTGWSAAALHGEQDLGRLRVPSLHRLAFPLIERLTELGRLEREHPYLLCVDLPLLGLALKHRGPISFDCLRNARMAKTAVTIANTASATVATAIELGREDERHGQGYASGLLAGAPPGINRLSRQQCCPYSVSSKSELYRPHTCQRPPLGGPQHNPIPVRSDPFSGRQTKSGSGTEGQHPWPR